MKKITKKEWDKLCRKVRDRDHNQCRGSTMLGQCEKYGEDVHHIQSRKKGGEDTMINLVCLCKRHHNIYETSYRKHGMTRMPIIWIKENKDFEDKLK